MDTPEAKQMTKVLMMAAGAFGSVPGNAATALPIATIAPAIAGHPGYVHVLQPGSDGKVVEI